MQALVYLFIALAGFALGATAYFGLSFTLAEAILVALVAGCIAALVMERRLRLRAEGRLERGIEDLSRLLATDAQAGFTNVQGAVVPDAGHWLMEEQPAATVKVIRAFLDRGL